MTFDREEGPASAAAYAARGVTLLVAVGGALALVRTAPDAKHLKKSVSDAHFTLLEYFVSGGWEVLPGRCHSI